MRGVEHLGRLGYISSGGRHGRRRWLRFRRSLRSTSPLMVRITIHPMTPASATTSISPKLVRTSEPEDETDEDADMVLLHG